MVLSSSLGEYKKLLLLMIILLFLLVSGLICDLTCWMISICWISRAIDYYLVKGLFYCILWVRYCSRVLGV